MVVVVTNWFAQITWELFEIRIWHGVYVILTEKKRQLLLKCDDPVLQISLLFAEQVEIFFQPAITGLELFYNSMRLQMPGANNLVTSSQRPWDFLPIFIHNRTGELTVRCRDNLVHCPGRHWDHLSFVRDVRSERSLHQFYSAILLQHMWVNIEGPSSGWKLNRIPTTAGHEVLFLQSQP